MSVLMPKGRIPPLCVYLCCTPAGAVSARWGSARCHQRGVDNHSMGIVSMPYVCTFRGGTLQIQDLTPWGRTGQFLLQHCRGRDAIVCNAVVRQRPASMHTCKGEGHARQSAAALACRRGTVNVR